jgi:anaerobic selenocysteine-containing dehydrogenase
MAAAGMYTLGGAFWEFGEPDWEHTKYFMMFGVAEDHDSNPIKMGWQAQGARRQGRRHQPGRTGYNAIADEWVGITPRHRRAVRRRADPRAAPAGKIDLDYLIRYTNAPWLVIDDPDGDDDGCSPATRWQAAGAGCGTGKPCRGKGRGDAGAEGRGSPAGRAASAGARSSS